MKPTGTSTLAILMAFTLSACTLQQLGETSAKNTRLSNEQQWIVESVGNDVAQIVLYASKGSDLDLSNIKFSTTGDKDGAEKYRYSLNCAKLKTEGNLALSKFIWSPENYRDLAAEIARGVHKEFENKSSYDSKALVKNLANFNSTKLAKANKDLSAQLSAHPLDAEINESAALLCGFFALRETAACFSDTRPWLNQMSAHLAIAEAARNGSKPSLAGQFSKVILLERSGLQKEALDALAQISSADQNDSGIKSLVRGLKMRITNDYRIADLSHAGSFEKLAYAGAISRNITTDALTDYLRIEKPQDEVLIDYFRLGMRGRATVESGHIFCKNSIQAEIQDAAHELNLFEGLKPANADELITYLNATANGALEKTGEKWVLSPISRSSLEAFHCRQLLDACYQTHHFLWGMWGVTDQAKEMLKETKTQLAKLTLYPLFEIDAYQEERKASTPELDKQLVDLSWNKPELITYSLWMKASKNQAEEPMRELSWFGKGLPYGTVYDFDNRLEYVRRLNQIDLSQLAALAPYDVPVLWATADAKYGQTATGAQLKTIYKSLADYSLQAMNSVAYAYQNSNKMAYIEQLEKIAKIEPDMTFKIAECYETINPSKAVASYEKALSQARDQVVLSHYGGWLIDYYRETEQHEKAEALANKVGEVYSRVGLRTQGYFQERSGRIQEAEETFKKIKERYDKDDELKALYVRHPDLNAVYKNGAEEAIKDVFPEGMKKYVPDTKPPTQGVRIVNRSFKTDKAGIQKGDIIVAVKGIAVGNSAQFALARESTLDTNVDYVIWRESEKKYLTKSIKLHNYLLGCDIKTYSLKDSDSKTNKPKN